MKKNKNPPAGAHGMSSGGQESRNINAISAHHTILPSRPTASASKNGALALAGPLMFLASTLWFHWIINKISIPLEILVGIRMQSLEFKGKTKYRTRFIH